MCSDNADHTIYPFCAVVGQERAKKALMLHAVHPGLHGVLLAGDAGTGKTTLIQGFADLFPDRRRVSIPLHVDDDRLLGGVETAASIRTGQRTYAAGLIAEADGHIVAINDANRMNGRIMRATLSACEDGGREIELAGETIWQPSSFLLLGTMNSKEAEMDSSLLDRWGICVHVDSLKETAEREEITSRRFSFEKNPQGFANGFESARQELQVQLSAASQCLPTVRIGEKALKLAAEISAEARCDGHRAEILLVEVARAIAALEGRREASADDVREGAEFVLPHRMRYKAEDTSPDASAIPEENRERKRSADVPAPLSPPEMPDGSMEGTEVGAGMPPMSGEAEGFNESTQPCEPGEEDGSASGNEGGSKAAAQAVVEAIGQSFAVRPFAFAPVRSRVQANAGKRNPAGENMRSGRYVRVRTPRGSVSDLALDATLRAAAPFQKLRRALLQPGDREKETLSRRVLVERSDIRVKVRESRTGTALLFVVDASGSMNAARRMKEVKGAVLSLLRDAYRQRDSVGLIAFREKGAELLLDITRSVELAEHRLRSMTVGGRTPLAAGLLKGAETIEAMLRKRSGHIPALIVITDGKTNASASSDENPWQEIRRIGQQISAMGIRTMVIDSEQGFVRLGYARRLADCLEAQYCRLEEMDASRIEKAARKMSAANK